MLHLPTSLLMAIDPFCGLHHSLDVTFVNLTCSVALIQTFCKLKKIGNMNGHEHCFNVFSVMDRAMKLTFPKAKVDFFFSPISNSIMMFLYFSGPQYLLQQLSWMPFRRWRTWRQTQEVKILRKLVAIVKKNIFDEVTVVLCVRMQLDIINSAECTR